MRELAFRQWRSLRLGYEVQVLDLRNFANGVQMVQVSRSLTSARPVTWRMELFLSRFEPIGDPIQGLTVWDHLSEE